MASTIRIAILANAVNAVRGLRKTQDETGKADRKLKELDRTIRRVSGKSVRVSMDTRGFAQGIAQIVLARAAIERLRKGIPDLSFGLNRLGTVMTAVAAGALALTAATVPLVGAATALSAAVGAAALGVGLFGAVALPTVKAVTTAVKEYNTASHAFDRAKAIGDIKKMAAAQDQMRSALGALTPAEQASAKALIAMNTAWSALSQSQAPLVLGILAAGAKTLAAVVPVLRPAIDAMASAVKSVSADAFAGIQSAIKPLVQLIVTQGVPAFKLLASITGNLLVFVQHMTIAFAPLGNAILRALDPVTNGLRKVNFSAFVSTVSDLLPLVGRLLGSLGGVIASITKAVTPLAGPVLAMLADIADAISDAFAGPDIKSFVASLVKLTPSITHVATLLIGTFGKFAAILAKQLVPLLPRLVPMLDKVAGVFLDVVAGVTPLAPQLLDLLGTFVDLLPSLTPVVTAMRDAMVPVLGAVRDALVILAPYIAPLADAFAKMIVAVAPIIPLLAQMAAVLAKGLTSALTGLAPLVANVVGFLVDHPAFAGAIAGAATAIWAIVAATKAWTAVTVALDVAMDANPVGLIILAIAALVAGIVYLATKTRFFQTIWAAYSDSARATGQYIRNVVDRIIETVRSVVGFVRGLVTTMNQFGVSIVRGFLDGIQSAWRWVVDKIAALVNLVPLSIRKALGIASPSKVMAVIGKQITQGLAGGIVNGVPALRSSLGVLSDEITGFGALPSISAPVAIAGGGRGVSTTYAINVSVAPTSDLAAVGQATVNAIKAHERRTGRRVLVPAL